MDFHFRTPPNIHFTSIFPGKMDVKWMILHFPTPCPHPFFHPILKGKTEIGCSGMDVDFRPLGKHGCEVDVAFIPPRKLDAQLDVAVAPPQDKMSCFICVWDDVCLLSAQIIACRCRAVHAKPRNLQRPTCKQGNTVATFSLHSIYSSQC